ncbi:MAG: hypothetical protein ACP59X_18075 [Solidesulfovibrio sp. DCME]|uniref:hypothetical protein n=1 Tax=Solidesulfovibrio sp. DCME TaxID=3447380 RepID=UPI003D0BD77C
MDQKQPDKLTLKDKIIIAFRPIEQLFQIMDSTSIELYGELTRSYSEVGITLCKNFRQRLDAIFDMQNGGSSDE